MRVIACDLNVNDQPDIDSILPQEEKRLPTLENCRILEGQNNLGSNFCVFYADLGSLH
jgi:hypothetical protein